MKVGQVFLEVFECVFDLQGAQAAQARLVAGGGNVGFVKNFEGDCVAFVYQGWKADEGLPATVYFHDFGQFAKAPVGVAHAFGDCKGAGLVGWARWAGRCGGGSRRTSHGAGCGLFLGCRAHGGW